MRAKTGIEQLEEHSRLITVNPDHEENAHEEDQNFPYRYKTVRIVAGER